MSVNEIFKILSNELVWNKKNTRIIKKASLVEQILYDDFELFEENIYGLGISLNRAYTFDFFISQDFDYKWIEKGFRQRGVIYKRNYIFTKGFKEQVQKSSNPILRTGDAVRHFKLNGYGTLGGYVSDRTSKYRLAISNNHVFALHNKAKIDDSLLRNADNTKFGGLFKFVKLLKPPSINYADVAAGWILEDHNLKWAWKKPKDPAKAINGMEVYKIGATSGYTEGYVEYSNFNLNINYKSIGELNFADCMLIRGKAGIPFSEPGDSGSFVFTKNHKLVGMVFAGNEDENISLANKIENIEKQLGIFIP